MPHPPYQKAIKYPNKGYLVKYWIQNPDISKLLTDHPVKDTILVCK